MAFPIGAAVWVSASPGPCAFAGAGVAANRRSGSSGRASSPGLRLLSGPAAAGCTPAGAGRHRRHRRSKSSEVRPVAVAAHPDRRDGHAADAGRSAGDRLRRRSSPSPTACRRTWWPRSSASSTRRRATRSRRRRARTACLANAIRRSRVVLGETGLPVPVPRPDAAPASVSVITAARIHGPSW